MTVTTAILCPQCSGDTSVKDSRKSVQHPNAAWRRRECNQCGHRFTTTEQLEDAVLAEAFIIELVLPNGSGYTTVTDDVSRIGAEVARIAGPRTYPATIHHWRCHRAINGGQIEWRKEKTFQWP